jgi:hypothetical protein
MRWHYIRTERATVTIGPHCGQCLAGGLAMVTPGSLTLDRSDIHESLFPRFALAAC